METKMDDMKLVVKELNSRLGKKLNVISYDNLRGEQRLEMLLQVFKEIDPTVSVQNTVNSRYWRRLTIVILPEYAFDCDKF